MGGPTGGFLVRLRLAESGHETVGGGLEVGYVEADELGAAHAAGESDQQQRPIPDPGCCLDVDGGHRGHGGFDVGGEHPGLAGLGGYSEQPADPSEGLGDEGVGAGGGLAGQAVGFGDGRQAPFDGGHRGGRPVVAGLGQFREVGGQDLAGVGRASTPRWLHQMVKSSQSER